jgi:flagellar basal-body rod protein FlgC
MKAMAISMSGMDVEWKRLEVIADNLAHMNVAIDTERSFIARHLVSGPVDSFLTTLQTRRDPNGVEVKGLRPSTNDAIRWVNEPENPLADARGMVAYPRIDHTGEMTAMVKAGRVYEANLAAFNMAKQMYSSALELGRAR